MTTSDEKPNQLTYTKEMSICENRDVPITGGNTPQSRTVVTSRLEGTIRMRVASHNPLPQQDDMKTT